MKVLSFSVFCFILFLFSFVLGSFVVCLLSLWSNYLYLFMLHCQATFVWPTVVVSHSLSLSPLLPLLVPFPLALAAFPFYTFLLGGPLFFLCVFLLVSFFALVVLFFWQFIFFASFYFCQKSHTAIDTRVYTAKKPIKKY